MSGILERLHHRWESNADVLAFEAYSEISMLREENERLWGLANAVKYECGDVEEALAELDRSFGSGEQLREGEE